MKEPAGEVASARNKKKLNRVARQRADAKTDANGCSRLEKKRDERSLTEKAVSLSLRGNRTCGAA